MNEQTMGLSEQDFQHEAGLGLPSKRYNLIAVAPSVADLVAMAGGLLCDRALAGWAITAVIGECTDATPLAILGIGMYCTPTDLGPSADKIASQSLVISMRSLSGGEKPDLLNSFSFRRSEVLLYGDQRRTKKSGNDVVEHRLSSASRAFKAHAQRAIGQQENRDGCVETFVRSSVVPQFGQGVDLLEVVLE